MKITGELLKAERIKQDLKIADIAFALKISSKVVQSLEEGESESLPAKTFVRGFVKSYAEYLRLDSAIVLKQFQEEMGSTSPVPKSPPPMPAATPLQNTKKEKEPPRAVDQKMNSGLTQKHIFIFISVSVFVTFLATINHFINKYSKERVEISVQPKTNLVRKATISSADQQLANITSMRQTVPANTNVSAVIENNNSLSDAADKSAETEKLTPQYSPAGRSSGKPVEILIEAKKNVSIEYAKGNSIVFEKILIKENSYQIIRSTTGLHLRMEDGSNLIFTVNGIIKPVYKSKPLQLTF